MTTSALRDAAFANPSVPSAAAAGRVCDRLAPFGQTIFTEISLLAAKHSAVNLGQGFPNFDGPEFVKEAAIAAIRAGHSQYARMFGLPEVNAAIAKRFSTDTGLAIDPERHVTVTSGCTEAIAAAIIGLLNPGDEIILIEPFYDSYRACVAMTGATAKYITLRPPRFELDRGELERIITPRARAILVNSPHNPTGHVFSRAELQAVADVALKHNLTVLSDEVYERLVYEGEHVSIATLPGMWERTITLSSLGKTFSLTGWKIGWAIAPPHLTAAVRAAHQFLTFATATPLQHAAFTALNAPDAYYSQFLAEYRARRERLFDGLQSVGLKAYRPQGTYFITVDHTSFGFADDFAFCRHLIEHVGVAAIPNSVFYNNPAEGRSLVRFAFCKRDETIDEAVKRMRSRLKPVR